MSSSAAVRALTVSSPSDGGQSRRTKSYRPSLTGSSARFRRVSRENWLTSSISAPARSIVEGTAWRPSTGCLHDGVLDRSLRDDDVVDGDLASLVPDAHAGGRVALGVEVDDEDPVPDVGECRTEAHGGRRLADPALLVRDRDRSARRPGRPAERARSASSGARLGSRGATAFVGEGADDEGASEEGWSLPGHDNHGPAVRKAGGSEKLQPDAAAGDPARDRSPRPPSRAAGRRRSRSGPADLPGPGRVRRTPGRGRRRTDRRERPRRRPRGPPRSPSAQTVDDDLEERGPRAAALGQHERRPGTHDRERDARADRRPTRDRSRARARRGAGPPAGSRRCGARPAVGDPPGRSCPIGIARSRRSSS